MREVFTINEDWNIFPCTAKEEEPAPPAAMRTVALPYVWNKEQPSLTGCYAYQKIFEREQDRSAKTFLEFGAVAGVCRVWLNGGFIGEHRGGYSRFRFELSPYLKNGQNRLTVTADNARYEDIAPLGGDFNNYGGIYRDVRLILTGNSHFELLDYGSSGIDLDTEPDGTVYLKAKTVAADGLQTEYILSDNGQEVARTLCTPADAKTILKVEKPHIWNGKADPHMYQCAARLLDHDVCVDEICIPFGFRTIEMTADQGLLLNGQPIAICGVAKHQDFEGMGCAPFCEQLDKDMELIQEIGANSVRLSHYQHPDYFYDLCDREGILVWAEIPMLGMPDGNDGVIENAKQQLKELIAQCRHHPSIFCWGIQNEIAMMGESLEMYKKTAELNELVHELDPKRLSACANLYCVKNNSQLNFITDMVGYNVYFGWYYDEMEDFEPFLDNFHQDNPAVALGVSEYGVDCSVTLHSANPKRKDYSEEFQCLFHETVYPMFRDRTWLWGSYVWNMFDFGSAIRDEGGVKGKNCKGLVTFDRKIKKDAFYYYKAWWSREPFVYLAGRRFAKRCEPLTTIKVYSNQPQITLEVNGTVFGSLHGEQVFCFHEIPLTEGENHIRALSGELTDEITLIKTDKPEQSYLYIDPNPGFNVNNWFTMGQSKDDLFPSDSFSVMDEIGTLKNNPMAWQLLEKELPQITNDPRSCSMPSITLLRVINRMSGQFEENFVKELNSRLNQIKK